MKDGDFERGFFARSPEATNQCDPLAGNPANLFNPVNPVLNTFALPRIKPRRFDAGKAKPGGVNNPCAVASKVWLMAQGRCFPLYSPETDSIVECH